MGENPYEELPPSVDDMVFNFTDGKQLRDMHWQAAVLLGGTDDGTHPSTIDAGAATDALMAIINAATVERDGMGRLEKDAADRMHDTVIHYRQNEDSLATELTDWAHAIKKGERPDEEEK